MMSNAGAKMGLRRPPYAFTEHGALQLATHKDLAAKLKKPEQRLDMSAEAIAELYAMLRKLMQSPSKAPKRRIGF